MNLLRNWLICVLMSLALPVFAGQAVEKPMEKAAEAPVAEAAAVDVKDVTPDKPAVEIVVAGMKDVAPDYQLNPEDVLAISVWKEEGLKQEVLVRPDGGISFPLVGDIQAAGKTAHQIENEIKLRLEKFIPDPVVSVAVLKVVGNKIYVIGKVNRPGEFVGGRYLDVIQALTMAGGLTPYASENSIKVLRKEGGKDTVFPFRYSEVKSGENLGQNIQLKGGDVVVVP